MALTRVTSSDCVAVGSTTASPLHRQSSCPPTGGPYWEGASVPATGFGDSSATRQACPAPPSRSVSPLVPQEPSPVPTAGIAGNRNPMLGTSSAVCPVVRHNLHGRRRRTLRVRAPSPLRPMGGATWTQESVPAGITDLSGVSCAAGLSGNGSNCIAVGYESSTYPMQGVVISSSDNGASWTEQTYPEKIYVLQGVLLGVRASPASQSDRLPRPIRWIGRRRVHGSLLARYGNIIATTDGGATWTSEESPGGVNELSSVSCPSTTECVAVGASSVGAPVGCDRRDGTDMD